MANPCIICEIVAGAAPASVVYTDDAVVAFMDLIQPRPGHVLIAPRQHVPHIYDLEEATGSVLMAAVIRLARAVQETFQPAGLSIQQANGTAAGQEIDHVHVHVLPRDTGDLVFDEVAPIRTERAELERLAALLRQRIGPS
jgi:histidine triad (HIT) family protein